MYRLEFLYIQTDIYMYMHAYIHTCHLKDLFQCHKVGGLLAGLTLSQISVRWILTLLLMEPTAIFYSKHGLCWCQFTLLRS